MEAHWQRVGNGHPASLAVAFHVIFFVADVEHHLGGIGGLHFEVGAPLLVDFREVVAGNGGLGQESVGGHLYRQRNLELRALGLIAQETDHSLAIAAAELAVACSVEVQAVGTIGAAV